MGTYHLLLLTINSSSYSKEQPVAMTPWLEWGLYTVSLVNIILLIWLGLTVLLNAARREAPASPFHYHWMPPFPRRPCEGKTTAGCECIMQPFL